MVEVIKSVLNIDGFIFFLPCELRSFLNHHCIGCGHVCLYHTDYHTELFVSVPAGAPRGQDYVVSGAPHQAPRLLAPSCKGLYNLMITA